MARRTVLFVDDERTRIDGLKRVLEKIGYEVFSAQNTEACRKILDSISIDLIDAIIILPLALDQDEFNQLYKRKASGEHSHYQNYKLCAKR